MNDSFNQDVTNEGLMMRF